ncbi:hypothetical protein FQZ97_1066700 [compost metagenome]
MACVFGGFADVVGQQAQAALQVVGLRGRAAFGRQPRGGRHHGGAHRVQIQDFLGGQLRDAGAALRADGGQAADLQQAQGLAHGGAADAVGGGKLRFAQAVARRPPAVGDLFGEQVSDLQGQGLEKIGVLQRLGHLVAGGASGGIVRPRIVGQRAPF